MTRGAVMLVVLLALLLCTVQVSILSVHECRSGSVWCGTPAQTQYEGSAHGRVQVPWPEPGGCGARSRGAVLSWHARALPGCLRARTQVHVRFVLWTIHCCCCVCVCGGGGARLQGLHHGAGVHPRGRGGPVPFSLSAGTRGNRAQPSHARTRARTHASPAAETVAFPQGRCILSIVRLWDVCVAAVQPVVLLLFLFL